ncbi:hypothetical protein AX17_004811 [Amanita inopinata Kibby_2008]|nr:hypothetical protein AX17_004811 [Amanita inopinata Kibby_2008]
MTGFAQGGIYGRFWVDFVPAVIPYLKYLPGWVPGYRWKAQAEHWRKASNFVEYSSFEAVKRDMENGTVKPCVVSRMLEALPEMEKKEREEAEAICRRAAGSAYLGGADTFKRFSWLW